MVETIAPVVYGRRRTYGLAVALHALAATASGAVTGALLGAAGWALGAPWSGVGYWLLAGVALVYATRETFGLPIPLPQARRQVPEWWRRFYPPLVAAGLYGAGLGVGFATYLSFGTYAAVAAGAVLSGSPAVGALACGAFGASRGVSVLMGHRAGSEDDSARVVEKLGIWSRARWPRALNAALLVAICVFGVASAL